MRSGKPRLAIIEDCADLREECIFFLKGKGYRVWGAASAEKFWKELHVRPADIVLVDISLPGEDGFSVIEQMQEMGRYGTIVISARGERESHQRGLDLGADVYLVKPISFSHLVSSIDSLWHRMEGQRAADPAPAREARISGGGWVLVALESTLAAPSGNRIKLSRQEYELMSLLGKAPQEVVSKEALHYQMFHHEDESNGHRISVILSRLRKKAQNQNIKLPIRAVFGKGLAFVENIEEL